MEANERIKELERYKAEYYYDKEQEILSYDDDETNSERTKYVWEQ